MTSELKALKRKRMREYKLKGKSVKYKRLKAEYDDKFEKAGFNFLKKKYWQLKGNQPWAG